MTCHRGPLAWPSPPQLSKLSSLVGLLLCISVTVQLVTVQLCHCTALLLCRLSLCSLLLSSSATVQLVTVQLVTVQLWYCAAGSCAACCCTACHAVLKKCMCVPRLSRDNNRAVVCHHNAAKLYTPCRATHNALLWRDKTCSACTLFIMS